MYFKYCVCTSMKARASCRCDNGIIIMVSSLIPQTSLNLKLCVPNTTKSYHNFFFIPLKNSFGEFNFDFIFPSADEMQTSHSK